MSFKKKFQYVLWCERTGAKRPFLLDKASMRLGFLSVGRSTIFIQALLLGLLTGFVFIFTSCTDGTFSSNMSVSSRTLPGPVTDFMADLVPVGEAVDLSWTSPAGNFTGFEITYSPGGGTPPSPITLTGPATSQTISELTNGTTYTFTITVLNNGDRSESVPIVAVPSLCTPADDDVDCDNLNNGVDLDADGNSLIEIHNLEQLNAVRYDLDGDGTPDPMTTSASEQAAYRTAYGIANDGDGCTACNGYELMRSLDFAAANSYASGNIDNNWRPNNTNPDIANNAGFPGIGDCKGDAADDNRYSLICNDSDDLPFNSILEGNGFAISNLYSRNTRPDAIKGEGTGLFRITGTHARIRNIGVMGGHVYGGDGDFDFVGGLVGWNSGIITASYATGDADGGDGGGDSVGGLVGWNDNGTVTASYATGDADGGDGGGDDVGGLVGVNSNGTITASYATGSADGGDGIFDCVGGLVGCNSGIITASYATGDADGGSGDDDRVGGLVGVNSNGTITASYATGMPTTGMGVLTVSAVWWG